MAKTKTLVLMDLGGEIEIAYHLQDTVTDENGQSCERMEFMTDSSLYAINPESLLELIQLYNQTIKDETNEEPTR